MDKTETYIKMCDCEDIQPPDRTYSEMRTDWHSYWVPRNSTEEAYSPHVWLPRQDQLQEMLKVKGVPIPSVAWVGYLLCLLQYDVGLKCTSMEQLWLAFVMKEKYNKVWDGDKWTSG